MSLATRCLACGTIFRVVQDQLKVSEGWVRCGRCDEVFNALDGLFDLDREAPPRWTAPPSASPADTADGIVIDTPTPQAVASHPPEPVAYAGAWTSGTAIGDRDPHGPTPSEPIDRGLQRHDPYLESPADRADALSTSSFDAEDRPADPVASTSLSPNGDERGPTAFADGHASAHAHDIGEFHYAPLPDDEDVPKAADDAASDLSSLPMHYTPMPAFVARADRHARWQQPGRLAGLSALALLLVTMLGLQGAHHFRDTVAVRWPVLREPLERWCAVAGCRLGAPRRIEDIVVENTGLTRAVAGTDTYRLAVTLRNRGAQLLALPYVDLTLTDNGGQLVARRALGPADFEPTTGKIAGTSASHGAGDIAPNAELPLQVLIAAGSLKVSGYTVEIFYP